VTIRIAHLSDIHFGGENAPATEAAIAAVAAFAPDLVAITGDLTLNGLPREFKAASAWLARLPRPQIVTPGNHDTPYWNLILRALTPFDRYRRYIGDADTTAFDGPGLTARSLNSARGAQPRLDWSKGAMAIDSLRRIAWDGPAGDGTLKIFACHHPLVDIDGAPVTGGVRRGDKAAEILAQARVDLVLTGHVHNPFALPLPYGSLDCYALGAGTLSLRTRGTPAGFSTIVAEDELFRVTALAWGKDRFEPMQSWELPRRRRPLGAVPGGEGNGPFVWPEP
jgi:3',5'-cyclic AMP phosphodiesterase CpdA